MCVDDAGWVGWGWGGGGQRSAVDTSSVGYSLNDLSHPGYKYNLIYNDVQCGASLPYSWIWVEAK